MRPRSTAAEQDKPVLRWSWAVAAAAAITLAAAAWHWYGSNSGAAAADAGRVLIDPDTVANIPSRDQLAQIENKTFLQAPLTADRIVWLIDGGSDMAEYYADLSSLVATSMCLLKSGEQKFGMYLASPRRSEYAPLILAGPASIEAARTGLKRFALEGRPAMDQAFNEVAAWDPQVVFLVVSQPTDQDAVASIIRRAKAGAIQVFVRSLGQPNFGWASVGLETNGDYLCLRDRDLRVWADRLVAPPLPQFREPRIVRQAAKKPRE